MSETATEQDKPAAEAPPRKRRRWPWVVGALVLLLAVAYPYRDRLLLAMLMPFITPGHDFGAVPPPPAPDYADPTAWAALPTQDDGADKVPDGSAHPLATDATVDVFFVHPTTYYKDDHWNGPYDDPMARLFTQQGVMRGQAGAFNATGNIYAPYYRQATLASYDVFPHENGKRAFDFAYQDVARAFDYWLEHHNGGCPFILASHSQGTTHAWRLLQERIAGTDLTYRLIAAYLIGNVVPQDIDLPGLQACTSPTDTGCVIAWNTYSLSGGDSYFVRDGVVWRDGEYRLVDGPLLQVNPLSWQLNGGTVPAAEHPGGVPMDAMNPDAPFRLVAAVIDADASGDLLRITPPTVDGFGLLTASGNFHLYDYHLFYESIRANALARTHAFLAGRAGKAATD